MALSYNWNIINPFINIYSEQMDFSEINFNLLYTAPWQ